MLPSEEELPVRRCVCGNVTFAELKELGIRTMVDAERLGCGVNCGLCRPFIERMIDTGETEFSVD